MDDLQILNVDLRVDASGALASARSVLDVLATRSDAPHALVEAFPDFLDAGRLGSLGKLRPEAFNLFVGKPVDASAGAALEVVLKPGDRYLDFATALARNFGVACDLDLHGWPILSSVGVGPSTVAEAGGATSASGGGPTA